MMDEDGSSKVMKILAARDWEAPLKSTWKGETVEEKEERKRKEKEIASFFSRCAKEKSRKEGFRKTYLNLRCEKRQGFCHLLVQSVERLNAFLGFSSVLRRTSSAMMMMFLLFHAVGSVEYADSCHKEYSGVLLVASMQSFEENTRGHNACARLGNESSKGEIQLPIV